MLRPNLPPELNGSATAPANVGSNTNRLIIGLVAGGSLMMMFLCCGLVGINDLSQRDLSTPASDSRLANVDGKQEKQDDPVAQANEPKKDFESSTFFPNRPGYDYVYERANEIAPSLTATTIRRHKPDRSVDWGFKNSKKLMKPRTLRVLDGTVEIQHGQTNEWGRLLPIDVREGDRWEQIRGVSKTTWHCTRVSEWQDPPAQFARYAGHVQVEIEMTNSVPGMTVPFESFSYTFVDGLGLVVVKTYLPTRDSGLSLIHTETLAEVVKSPSD